MHLRVIRLGSHAANFVRRHRSANVAAAFDRSLHLEADGDVLCLGAASLGNGPLNAIVDGAPGWDWIAHAGPPGGIARIDRARLRVGDLVLDASDAAEWQPPAWPREILGKDVLAGLHAVETIAARTAPTEGLARPALGLPARGATTTPLERVATPNLATLRAWLSAGISPPPAPVVASPAPTGLLGLGPGLTPSGDDLLCGVEIALHALGRSELALALAAAIGAVAAERTTTLSHAFLRAAADGEGSAVLHETIAAILQGTARELPALVAHLGRIGHTSGWDALAGVVLAVRACAAAEADPSRQSP